MEGRGGDGLTVAGATIERTAASRVPGRAPGASAPHAASARAVMKSATLGKRPARSLLGAARSSTRTRSGHYPSELSRPQRRLHVLERVGETAPGVVEPRHHGADRALRHG